LSSMLASVLFYSLPCFPPVFFLKNSINNPEIWAQIDLHIQNHFGTVRALVFGFYRNVFSFEVKVNRTTVHLCGLLSFFLRKERNKKKNLFFYFALSILIWSRSSPSFFWTFLVSYSFRHIRCLFSFGQKYITRSF
jgi:hypothetical protein